MANTLLGRVMSLGGKLAPGDRRRSKSRPAPAPARCHVQLAISTLGPRLPTFQAYHTSVLVNGIEFSFSGLGISRANGTFSHAPMVRNGAETIVIDFGIHAVSMEEFERALRPFFQRGTYDLLRKNCNSFSDCALFYLTGGRLDKKYRFLESIGKTADKYTSVVQAITGGGYNPNPMARDFECDDVVRALGAGGRVLGGGGRHFVHGPFAIAA